MSHLNIEFKARYKNTEEIRKILKSKNAQYIGKDHQIDTYFNIDGARLKLREGNIETALIHYDRKNQEGPKQSNVILYHPDPTKVKPLKNILIKTLGVMTIVDKKREIYFIENVKFHIDLVNELGSFIEVEAIDKDGTIGVQKLQEQCSYYLNLFKISEEDLISNSYSDLLLSKDH